MLQRINFILMLVLVAAVAFLSVQLFVTQRQNAAVLREMAQKLSLVSPATAAPTGSLPSGRAAHPSLAELPGRWRPAPGEETAPDAGAVLDIVSEDDIMNLSGTPAGVLDFPALGLRLRLAFTRGKPDNLGMWLGEGQAMLAGRWQLENGALLLNIASAVRGRQGFQAPLMFVKAEPPPPASGPVGTSAPQPAAAVLVQGDVSRKGWFPIRLDGAPYLHEVLEQAGARPEQWVVYSRNPGVVYGARELLAPSPKEIILHPEDSITVFNDIPMDRLWLPRGPAAALKGGWVELDAHGNPAPGGWAFEVASLSEQERRLLDRAQRIPAGTLRHPGSDTPIGLRFCYGERLLVSEPGLDGTPLGFARFSCDLSPWRLTLDVAGLYPGRAGLKAPIVLVMTDELPPAPTGDMDGSAPR